MPPPPMQAPPPGPDNTKPAPGMSTSEAMDVLDEFHIKRSDYDRVMEALEAILGPSDETDSAPDADNKMDAQQAMADEMFAPNRNRKAV